jgi:hypothetical protein
MADEGAGGNIAGEQCRADDPGDQHGERQRPPQQALTMPKGTLPDAMGSPLAPYSYRVDGPVAGLFVGGNYQINKIVLGVEGDWQWPNLEIL